MASEVSICNQALSWLGETHITSLDDPSTVAKLCKVNYPELRDAVLEECLWTFAQNRYTLDLTEVQIPPHEFTNKYSLSTGILLVHRGFDGVGKKEQTKWERRGDYIYSDANPLFIETTDRETSPNSFTTTFRQALAARIAQDLCIAITNDRKLWETLKVMYDEKLARAASLDGRQGLNEHVGNSKLIQVRNGGRGS